MPTTSRRSGRTARPARRRRESSGTRGRSERGAADPGEERPADRAGERLDQAPVEEEFPPRRLAETGDARLGRELAMWQVETWPHAEVPGGFREARLREAFELRRGNAAQPSVEPPETAHEAEHDLF